MDDLTFEPRVLSRLAAEASYPPTPDLRGRVVASIAGGEAQRRTAGAAVRPLALAASAVLLAIAVTVTFPGSRHAVADFFGVRGSRVEILPTPAPGTSPTPPPTPSGIRWIATPTSLERASKAATFEPALPPGYGQPLQVYLVDYAQPPVIVLQYPRFDLWESQSEGFFVKGVQPGIPVHDRTIKGRPATWIGEGEHIVVFEDQSGKRIAASVRTVERSTLIWNSGPTFYRMETDLSEEAAVGVAESLP